MKLSNNGFAESEWQRAERELEQGEWQAQHQLVQPGQPEQQSPLSRSFKKDPLTRVFLLKIFYPTIDHFRDLLKFSF